MAAQKKQAKIASKKKPTQKYKMYKNKEVRPAIIAQIKGSKIIGAQYTADKSIVLNENEEFVHYKDIAEI